MDIVFDIDGTLADATHRLKWITDPAYWAITNSGVSRPNWETFLSDDLVVQDSYILETWAVLDGFLEKGDCVIFITGRPEKQRELTWNWLVKREPSFDHNYNRLYMRKDKDYRPSHEVKRELLLRARADGFNPIMAFEDRIEDTKMWRSEGLRCFQVAEGNY